MYIWCIHLVLVFGGGPCPCKIMRCDQRDRIDSEQLLDCGHLLLIAHFESFQSNRRMSALQIKSVEVEGFKGIKDKVHIDFSPRSLTSIVGANGLGKSCLIEAL